MRKLGFTHQFQRCVYISARSLRDVTQRRPNRNFRDFDKESEQKADQIDAQLRELKKQQAELRQKLRDADEQDSLQKLARRDNADLKGEASMKEIAALEGQLSLSSKSNNSHILEPSISLKKSHSAIPSSIRKILSKSYPNKAITLFPKSDQPNWIEIFANTPVLPEETPVSDVELLISSVPLKTRSQIVQKIEMCIPVSLQTQYVKDQLMAAYAEKGMQEDVRRLFNTCVAPTQFSYAHLIKAVFKNGALPEEIFSIIKSLQSKNLEPNLPILSSAIQSLIQHGRHKEAENLFDNLKYWSVSTQPDLKLYNSMILSASKQHNVNRCLDLITEMKERRPHPLEPNAETYNYAVSACARQPETQLKAWDLFLEARSLGFAPDQQSFKALLYLCGSSGELALARALVRNLSDISLRLVDSFTLNSLFLAYKHWQPGPSKILSSPHGRRVRENLILGANFEAGSFSQALRLPLLPRAQLEDKRLILAESKALLEFCAESYPEKLVVANRASLATSPIVHNYLEIAMNLADGIEEFKSRYLRFTRYYGDKEEKLLAPESEQSPIAHLSLDSYPKSLQVQPHPGFSVDRSQHIYQLAIKAAIKFKNMDFGREVWTERGKWRRLAAFRNLSQIERNAADFRFARSVVELLAVSGNIEEAILLVKSTNKLGRWKKHHLAPLIQVCETLEDVASASTIMNFLNSQK